MPRVFADHHRHRHASDVEHWQGAAPWSEVALLVEDLVVREQPLVEHTDHTAVGADRGGVVQPGGVVAHPGGNTDDGNRVAGGCCHTFEGGEVVVHEAWFQQQVLRRVAADREFAGDHDVGAGEVGAAVCGQQPLDVAVKVANGGVQLRDSNTELAAGTAR